MGEDPAAAGGRLQFLTPIQRYFIGCSLAFFLGAWCMDQAHKKHQAQPEAPAAAVVQADRSLILERNPATARPQLPKIPKNAKVQRVTTVTVQQDQPGPVAVVLTQIETPTGSRVIASTPAGQILAGQDFTGPVVGPPRPYRWQLHAVRSLTADRAAWGASLGYCRGPFVASVTVIPGPAGQILAGAGVRW